MILKEGYSCLESCLIFSKDFIKAVRLVIIGVCGVPATIASAGVPLGVLIDMPGGPPGVLIDMPGVPLGVLIGPHGVTLDY